MFSSWGPPQRCPSQAPVQKVQREKTTWPLLPLSVDALRRGHRSSRKTKKKTRCSIYGCHARQKRSSPQDAKYLIEHHRAMVLPGSCLRGASSRIFCTQTCLRSTMSFMLTSGRQLETGSLRYTGYNHWSERDFAAGQEDDHAERHSTVTWEHLLNQKGRLDDVCFPRSLHLHHPGC